MSESETKRKRGPIRKYAKRKQPNEPSVVGGLWFSCSEQQYQSFEVAATREGVAWVNRWAFLHLANICESGESVAFDLPALREPADHIQPADRVGTGVWIDSIQHLNAFTKQATIEGFPTVLEWGLHHLENIASTGATGSHSGSVGTARRVAG